MGVPKGKTFVDWIRAELVGSSLVVAVVTPRYLESAFCLCELGATWATQAAFYPLLVPPVAYDDLKAVLVGCQVGIADRESDLDDMFERVKAAAGTSPDTGRWNQKKRTFITRVRRFSSSTAPARPSATEAEKLRETIHALEAELAEATERLDDQADVIEQLRASGSKKAPTVMSKTTKGQLDELNRLSGDAMSALADVPHVVREALYQRFCGNQLIVDGWKNREQLDDAYEAFERGYLKGDAEAGTYEPDDDNQRVEEAIGALADLDGYLLEVPPDALNVYRSEYGYSPDLSKRQFWDDNLGL